jgi:hypothetical protein
MGFSVNPENINLIFIFFLEEETNTQSLSNLYRSRGQLVMESKCNPVILDPDPMLLPEESAVSGAPPQSAISILFLPILRFPQST